ncbi:MAG: fumarate hydratase [Chitinivibrionales bacterium]|nr:fumarate hydratase [Chitinivibrionales bacterium]MBD3394956.1 fumarate hydratase [Chitinivibrionales bacterium]
MKTIAYENIVTAVEGLCLTAAYDLPGEVGTALAQALGNEDSSLARAVLKQCMENARLAAEERTPICQDTGFAVYFVELGQEVRIEGGLLADAVREGTARGYQTGYLRASIVEEPLYGRKNTGDNTPPVVHLSLVGGEALRITLAPKGAGSENASAFRIFKPSDGEDAVADFVVETVVGAGGNPCPPTIIGIGIGGTFETAALLSKKALVRPLNTSHHNPRYAALERAILERINASGVGPQGLGGSTTALAVHIETFPCHMASLPVAVNINCHAARHATVVL